MAMILCASSLPFLQDCAAADESTGSAKAGAPKTQPASKPSKPAQPSQPPHQISAPAPQVTYNGPQVLDPSNYYGTASVGYAAAKSAPEVMSKLFCYCGCDITDKHKQLIDCFTSSHGVDCHICQEEAVLGLKLHRAGVPLASIQRQIDEEYAKHYPFQEESASLKQYKATRLWKTDAGQPAVPGLAANSTDSGTKSASAPRLKPGFQAGNCCAEKSSK